MKAKVIKTGEIVDVYHEPQHGQTTIIYKESVFVNGRMWSEDEIEILKPQQIYITPEILKKNGFELKPDGWLWCEHEGIEDQNYIFIQFRKGCDEVRLVELNFVNKVLAKYEQMHFIHELQHALRLCNINKEVEV